MDIFSRIKYKIQSLVSMRLYILLLILIVGIVPMIVLTAGLISAYRSRALSLRVSEVQQYGSFIINRFFSNGALMNTEDTSVDDELSLMASIYGGRIIVVNQDLTVVRDTYGQETGKILIAQDVVRCLKNNSGSFVNRSGQYGEVTMPVASQDSDTAQGVLVITFTLRNIDSMTRVLNQKATVYIIIIILAVGVIALIGSKLIARPLNVMNKTLSHLSEGYLDEEVSFTGYSEIKKISDSFNRLISRMKSLESSRQEFVSNVSHELKTPITSMKVLADSLLTQENVPAETYREFLTDINEEVERENKIINDLLSLVKLDKSVGEVHVEEVNINELLEGILKRLNPIAQKRGIEMVFESFRPVTAEVDEVKLSLAISNLIENAIKYNVDDGWVRVSLNADHKYFYVKVSDSGIGIPDEAQGLIFERFYRVDKARTRETGGTGLGLSIARNAVMLHKGAIKVYSKENEGTTFTVRIPLSYIP